jgi:hypothetical protein
MKHLLIILAALFAFGSIFGQHKTSLFRNPESEYYSATNFAKPDSLNAWFYVLVDKNLSYPDAVKPIGQLIFQRGTMVKGRTTNFTFQVFNIKDSAYCFKKSQQVRTLSSCVPPNVAGDIIIVNQFIFLNTDVCLQCRIDEKGPDYCRPLINKVFASVDKSKVHSLNDLVKQFPIEGQILNLPF